MLKRKAKALVIGLFLLLGLYSQAQLPDGQWWLGMIEEASLPLNLYTFAPDLANGKPIPILYSPMQSKDEIIPSSSSVNGDTIRLQVESLGIKMTLIFHAEDTTLRGKFRQGMLVSDITFKPSDGLYTMHRPQEPQPPFPYSEKRMVLKHKDSRGEQVNIGVTLTIPDNSTLQNSPLPCVLLISGSGMQNRDEELMGHKPFHVLADHLARHGIASLRYDDRGTGESTGDIANVTTDILADDAEWLFNWLRKQPSIDLKRVGIVGHSEGGVIAPIIASRNRNVAFIVMLAGPGVDGASILRQQNRDLYIAGGIDSSLVAIRDAFLKDCFDAIGKYKDSELDSLYKALASNYSKGLSKTDRKKISLSAFEASQMAAQMKMPWMQRFVQLDPTPYLKKVKCPVLALNGSKDLQVSAIENLAAITKSVKPNLLTVKQLDGLNHLFQHCDKGLPSEYMLIEETFAPEALEIISTWINERF
ncbi:MAG: alpha/beta hydrolase [Bacteroidales bacterium]|nr:alpha/beta hydrolase [Bacteroidales bacterium]